jgi:hypothetical protein
MQQDSFKVVSACNDKIDIIRVVGLGVSISMYLIDGGGCLHSCLDPQESISCLVDWKGLMLLSINDGAPAYELGHHTCFAFFKQSWGHVKSYFLKCGMCTRA